MCFKKLRWKKLKKIWLRVAKLIVNEYTFIKHEDKFVLWWLVLIWRKEMTLGLAANFGVLIFLGGISAGFAWVLGAIAGDSN